MPASAHQLPIETREEVKYSALDLATSAGTTEVYNRIRQAAKRVCWAANAKLPILERRVSVITCSKEAIAQAIKDTNRTELRAMHANRTLLAAR